MITFTHVDADRQLFYSPLRDAIGEYVKIGDGWTFLGWIWDGQVRDLTHAYALTTEYVNIFRALAV